MKHLVTHVFEEDVRVRTFGGGSTTEIGSGPDDAQRGTCSSALLEVREQLSSVPHIASLLSKRRPAVGPSRT